MDRRAAPGSLLRSFERHLRAQNRSERTVGNYLESARLAEAFLEGRGRRLEEATQADLEEFLGDILRRRSANTAATRYKVLRVLYRWLEDEEELPNPMARTRPPIIPEQPVPIVPADGLRRLLAACAGRGFEARRDTAIIMLLLDTGARRAELADLQFAHVDLDLDVLLVLGEGRRERALPFGHKAGEALERYLRVSTRHKHAQLPWLWIGLKGRLTAYGVVMMLRRRGRQAGLPGSVSPPVPPYLCPPVAGRGRRRDRPHAAGGLEVPRHAAALRRLPPTPAPARPTAASRPPTDSEEGEGVLIRVPRPSLFPQDRPCHLLERCTAGDRYNRSASMACGPNVDQARDAQRTGKSG
jgi:integrase/recombinase XerC